MATIETIPVECLGGLDVREGDTLRILASRGNELVVEIHRDAHGGVNRSASIRHWLSTAKGSVRTGPDESADDARMEYYTKKYGLDD